MKTFSAFKASYYRVRVTRRKSLRQRTSSQLGEYITVAYCKEIWGNRFIVSKYIQIDYRRY